MRRLSRTEMKMVNGGRNKTYSCTFTFANGTTQSYEISGTGAEAQCAADHACIGDNNCTNADCEGSGAC